MDGIDSGNNQLDGAITSASSDDDGVVVDLDISTDNNIGNNEMVDEKEEPTSTIVVLKELPKDALSGFSLKYTWNNVPMEVLVEIFKYMDQTNLSTSSLVSRDWYESSKHDLLWYDNCVELFKKIYTEQIDCKCGF